MAPMDTLYRHVSLLLLSTFVVAQPVSLLENEEDLRSRLSAAAEELDLQTIMLGEDFFGAAPSGVRWSDRSDAVTFSWKRWDEQERRTWRYAIGDAGPRPWPDDRGVPPNGQLDRDLTWRVWVEGPCVYVEELATGEINEVLRVAASIRDAQFSVHVDAVLVHAGDGLFRVTLGRPGVTQLLKISEAPRKEESDESEDEEPPAKPKDLADYHKREQRLLSRVLRQKERRAEARKERRKKREERLVEVPSYGPPKGFRVTGVRLSPAGDRVAFTLVKKGESGRVADMPDYVTADGYTETRPTRAKVGDKTAERRLEIMDLSSGAIVAVKPPAKDRGAYPSNPSWSRTGEHLVAQARADDDRDVWLMKVDPATGATQVLHHRQDDAWVGWADCRPRWLADSSRLMFVSEATGWAQLWLADVASGDLRQLTQGSFEVRDPVPSPDGRTVYAVATPTSPHVADLVEIDAADGALTVLTADGGGRSFSLSPDGTKVAEVFSTADTPWELRIRWLDGSRPPFVVTDSPSPAFKGYGSWSKPPIVRFKASDGTEVPARIYRPAEPLPGKPAVLFVHGAGYLQNVHQWWSSYYREYGFHHLLRDAGYTVLDVDYRGSAGYGRDWRTAIYGHMGGRDLGDYVDAARWLREQEGCGRLGIYGGSYGGFMTLMALFTKPGVFSAGAALRPVTDWAHYNDGYTSNILDDPLESPDHYRKSSPIWHAEGLEDHLLICHGVLDSNVHAQGVFRLQQRLIELRKGKWEVAYYPLEGHGFTDAASWYDEYRRIKELFDRTLRP